GPGFPVNGGFGRRVLRGGGGLPGLRGGGAWARGGPGARRARAVRTGGRGGGGGGGRFSGGCRAGGGGGGPGRAGGGDPRGVSRPVWPRGHSRTSVRVSMMVTSESSASLRVSDSVSRMNQSQSKNSLPRKSRLASSGSQATLPAMPGTNALGTASSTPRV